MRLRRYLEEDARSPRLLETVRGVGYRLAER
jgi:DNA-binding response OmpR family regulator